MQEESKFESFAEQLDDFHGDGHVRIAQQCSDNGNGPMITSSVSGRDPIFYRWHTFFENTVQEFRDTKEYFPYLIYTFPELLFFSSRYGLAEFQLSSDIEVTAVNTILDKDVLSVNKDIQNLLITHWETRIIRHDWRTPIRYTTLSHKNFKYHVHINNPRNVRKKVFIRLWLGILKDKNDYRLATLI